jgi:hypothetical protein
MISKSCAGFDVLPRLLALCLKSSTALVCHVAVVRIPDIQPKRSIVAQHAPHFTKNPNRVLDVKFRSRLQSEVAEPRSTELAE